MKKAASIVFSLATLVSSGNALAVNAESIISSQEEWLSHGRDYTEQRFSPLEQINKESVDKLDLAWSFQFDTARGMEATPIMHQGILYVSTGWSHVHALDARSGEELWHFDAGVDKAHLQRTCCGPVNRGVALWQGDEENSNIRLFFGALDGRLISLDATTGEQLWSIQTTPEDKNYSITGAPRIVNGLVIIGNGGAELGARGFVSAYDAYTGEMRWRFYTVPSDPNKPQDHLALEQAVSTWSGSHWYDTSGGGGTVWDSIVYDAELDLLYIGTGNGSPWNRAIRSPGGGDNLYLSSIVALKPETGEYVWHYQVTPKENWDYTATQQMVLADIEFDGSTRKVLMQAPKNGFFYVLDRVTGELLAADPYAYVTWASHIDMETGRPVETKYGDYQSYGGTLIWPGSIGAHNWQPMSYSPQTGLMYIPVQNAPAHYSAQADAPVGIGRWNTGIDLSGNRDSKDWVTAKAGLDAMAYGELVAWDPVKQERAWEVRKSDIVNGGILSTAGGLVFQGGHDGTFAAFDAADGDKLWEYQSDSAIMAGPISFELDGEQYIAVAQGRGGALALSHGSFRKRKAVNTNRLLVFKLGDKSYAKSAAAPNAEFAVVVGSELDLEFSEEEIEHGKSLYGNYCSFCHGISAKSNGITPDLRHMSEETQAQFVGIVYGGLLKDQGMPAFFESLSLEEVNTIQTYLKYETSRLPDMQEMSFLQKIQYWAVYYSTKASMYWPTLANMGRELTM